MTFDPKFDSLFLLDYHYWQLKQTQEVKRQEQQNKWHFAKIQNV